MTTPNPGSREAVARGCTCAVVAHHNGRGVPPPEGARFWITLSCPLHGQAELFPDLERDE